MLHVEFKKKLRLKTKNPSLAVLTSGGDAPGMNAAIRAVVRYGLSQGCDVYGVQKGYRGLIDRQIFPLTASSVANIIQRGGTLLKTDRCEEFFKKAVRKKAAEHLREIGIDGLIVIGGDGSFAGAHALQIETGFPVIGVPGTIDNDIAGTEDTIGFDTAINTAIDAIDKIRDTASSHDRIFIVEVMGRSSGFIALEVAIGGGAETVIVPERQLSLDQMVKQIEKGIARGKSSSIIVVAEGKTPGLSNRVAEDLQSRGYHSRVCILGHTQRGGTPTAHDRLLASTLGAAAVQAILSGKSDAMMGVMHSQVVCVPFRKVIGVKKKLSLDLFELAQRLAT